MVRLHHYQARTAKPVYLYLLRGERRTLLIGSARTDTPAGVLLPGLAADGLGPEQLTDCVMTHTDCDRCADCDHCGGNAELKCLCPACALHASSPDRPLIEDPAALMRERYQAYEARHAAGYDQATNLWIRRVGGGDELHLGGATVRVWPLPGHGEDALDGTLQAPPGCLEVTGPVPSIQRVRRLNPARLAFAHREPLEGAAVTASLDESEVWVREVELGPTTCLQRRGSATLRELLSEHASTSGRCNVPGDLMDAFAAHLDRLEAAGTLRAAPDGDVRRYRWAG